MLNGTRYFASFPDEDPQPDAPPQAKKLLSPELRAALDQLSRDLEDFLKSQCSDRLAEAT